MPVAAKKQLLPLTRSSVVRHGRKVVAEVDGRLPLGFVARCQQALDLATHALQRRGSGDALGRAAGAEQHIDAGIGPAAGDRTEDVAVGDQLDPRAAGANFGDEVGVPFAVEDDDREVADATRPWPWRSNAGSASAWR